MGVEEDAAARTIWKLVRPHWLLVTLAILASAAAAAFEGSTMALFALALEALFGAADVSFGAAFGAVGAVADRVLGGLEPRQMFMALVSLAVGTTIARGGLQFGGATASAYLQTEVFKDVWNRIFGRIMSMKYAQVSQYKAGDLNQYVWDAHVVYQLLAQINRVIGNLLVMGVYLAVLLWLSLTMTLMALPILVLLTISVNGLVRRVRQSAEDFVPARVEMGSQSLEFLSGLRLVRLFAREQYAKDRMAGAVDEAMLHTRRRTIWLASVPPVMQSVSVIGIAGLVLLGYFVLADLGQAALPRLLTFLFVVYRLLPLVGSLNQQRASFNDLFPLIRRVSTMLNAGEEESPVDDQGTRFSGLRKGIEFHEVSLRYVDGEQPAVSNLSFTVPRGRMIALVGESGAGKSTVADLLLRLYDPTSGHILVDGVDLRGLNLPDWRGHCGVVSQDTFVFNVSIRENILFGRLDASDSEIVAAARAAHAHDFIEEMSDGYETIVGDRGYRLSGGERQRIAIARAILRDPDLLVLDEATSDLDSKSERLIQHALHELRAERTVLAIAHRLSTVVLADEILVLHDGHIVERGTHRELLALKGRYHHFWQLQSQTGELDQAANLTSVGSAIDA
ncbi:MAG: ABC transporter ATP-binding protein [Gemmatimonadetes bacterium]|nr:ABC transporter ATP-binding protein [Gemmatimonadota bacterium]